MSSMARRCLRPGGGFAAARRRTRYQSSAASTETMRKTTWYRRVFDCPTPVNSGANVARDRLAARRWRAMSTILILDDDRVFRRLAVEALEKRSSRAPGWTCGRRRPLAPYRTARSAAWRRPSPRHDWRGMDQEAPQRRPSNTGSFRHLVLEDHA